MLKLVEKSTIFGAVPSEDIKELHILKYDRSDIGRVVGSFNLLVNSYTKMILDGIKFECEVIVYDVFNDLHFPYLTFKIERL